MPIEHFRGTAVLALSGDGRRLAITNSGSMMIDLVTGQQTPLPAFEGTVANLHFSPDDRMLTVRCGPEFVYLIDAGSGAVLHMLRLPSMPTAMACSPDSGALAVAADGKVTLWHAETGQELATLHVDRKGDVIALQFSADGRKLAAVVDDSATHELSLFIW